MGKINIQGLNELIDPFYRYKRDTILVVPERNLTAIANLEKVSKDIGRNEDMLLNYIKRRFGGSFTKKNNRILTAKNITTGEMELAISEFIEYLVLCPECGLPETKLYLQKKSIICECCGYNGEINPKYVNNKTIVKLVESEYKKI
jgi:translation initiation factor 2 subunit 2